MNESALKAHVVETLQEIGFALPTGKVVIQKITTGSSTPVLVKELVFPQPKPKPE
jgi:hypothetical protein